MSNTEEKSLFEHFNDFKDGFYKTFVETPRDFGKKNFLKKGDEIFVYVYNAHAHSFQDIMNDMCGMDTYLGQCSKLHQIVK